MGMDIPPLEEYKRLGAYIQRCESKVMLTILSLISPEEPASVIWLHDGIYLHNTFDLQLAERLCSKGAQMAGFPHLVFKVTTEAPTDGEDPEEDTESSEEPPIEKVVTAKPKLEGGKQGKVVTNSISMLKLLKDPSDTAARVKRLAQTL